MKIRFSHSLFSASARIQRFFVREDAQYDAFLTRYQAKTAVSRLLYLFLHLLPGIVAYCLINISSIHNFALHMTGLPDPLLQYSYLILFTFFWHMLLPFLILRWSDKLSFRESLAFLGLDHFDAKGVLLVLPVVFLLFTMISLPYMKYVFPLISAWVNTLPGLSIPAYSIFQQGKLYAFAPIMLFFLFVGNFVGEEIYFRGYLFKKIGFLGSWAWVVSSLLFALYHIWQAPQTWALIGPVLIFGLFMRWRKNLYPLIFLHLLVNLVWGGVVMAILAR